VGRTTLIIDHDPASSLMLAHALRPCVGEIQFASDAQTASDLLRDLPFGLIVLDLRTAERGNVDLIQRIYDNPLQNDACVFALTVYEHQTHNAVRGDDCILLKPVLPTELRARVLRLDRDEDETLSTAESEQLGRLLRRATRGGHSASLV
jgi:DNA-binding response OmpR family regulator